MSKHEDLGSDLFFDHKHRTAIRDETHARLIPPVGVPNRGRRIVFKVGRDPEKMQQVARDVSIWLAENGVTPPPENWRQHNFSTSAHTVTIEAHTEFFTVTWYGSVDDPHAYPSGIGLEVFRAFPIVSAIRIDIVEREEISTAALEGFEPKSLCLSRTSDGRAQIGTDFQSDQEGFTRFEIATSGLGEIKAAILLRRLFEVETYRAMALLGLPEARIQAPIISALEADLIALNVEIGQVTDIADSKNLLQRLHALSVRVGTSLESTSYRFAASQAYGSVMEIRLKRIAERQSEKHTTIERYVSNRVGPALATCAAIEKRQLALSDKIARAIQLLDTRINVDIQSQNQLVLASISKTAQSQYRLQTTVEGLSTIAITYYALGILGYLFAGLSDYIPISKSLSLALAAPFVLGLTWLGIRAIKQRHSD